MGLETATSGKVNLDGENVENIPIEKRDTSTISNIQMVFQNPFDTLNPSMSVGRQIITGQLFITMEKMMLKILQLVTLLDLVKLPREFATRMPRQLSGGHEAKSCYCFSFSS